MPMWINDIENINYLPLCNKVRGSLALVVRVVSFPCSRIDARVSVTVILVSEVVEASNWLAEQYYNFCNTYRTGNERVI